MRDIIEIYCDPTVEIEKPRNFSKKTEFIRRFFESHPEWKFLDETIRDLMLTIDRLADARNAFAHGTITNLPEILEGEDSIIIHLERKVRGKTKHYEYTFPIDGIYEIGRHSYAQAVFVGRLGEILREEFTGDERLENLMSEIASQGR